MPVVTVDPAESEQFELKTAPPDGFVKLRPLPYGMKVQRRGKAIKMLQRVSPDAARRPQNAEQVFEMESMDEWAVAYDFAYCIVDHNLTDKEGNKLDFANPLHVKALNPKVGSEIEQLIDKLNNEEDEETLEDFLKRQSDSSSDSQNKLNEDGKELPTATATH